LSERGNVLARQYLDFLVARPALLCALLFGAVAALYVPFLWNPLVFDDVPSLSPHSSAFDGWLAPSFIDLRWVGYASFAWTKQLLGWNLVAFRTSNLLLHATNAALLFLFLRRVFHVTVARGDRLTRSYCTLLAFSCGLVYALHPLSVYATAYLIQRSTLFAALFALLMWITYLEGLVRNKQSLLLASALFYYLAVFSKELAIMVPTAVLCFTLVLRRPSIAVLKAIAPTFLLYACVAAVAVFKSLNVIGNVYEPQAQQMLTLADPQLALPLSMINQSYLFFKYLVLWILPNPAWMSADMREPFPLRVFSVPQVLGPVFFGLYGAAAILLLLKSKDVVYRLTGFGLLSPLFLFIPEFSTVRIQEPFVLYRSYLWFGGLFAVLPLLALRFGAKKVFGGLVLVAVLFVPLTWNRLNTFSDLLLFWNDAAKLVSRRADLPGADRIFYNRGNALLARKQIEEAFSDYTTVIRMNPKHAGAYNNRGTIYYNRGRYAKAVQDFKNAVESSPSSRRPYFGLGMSYLALGRNDLAKQNLERSCTKKFQLACAQLDRLKKDGSTRSGY
jgi:tetratricopeptide (TPR) repeat protein